jgi:hypothetical protein
MVTVSFLAASVVLPAVTTLTVPGPDLLVAPTTLIQEAVGGAMVHWHAAPVLTLTAAVPPASGTEAVAVDSEYVQALCRTVHV